MNEYAPKNGQKSALTSSEIMWEISCIALEIFLVMRYINLLFTYLLTYLLTQIWAQKSKRGRFISSLFLSGFLTAYCSVSR